jgi:hypothetical protein
MGSESWARDRLVCRWMMEWTVRQFCGVRCLAKRAEEDISAFGSLSYQPLTLPHCHRFLYLITTLVQPQVELQCYAGVGPGRDATRHDVCVLYQYTRGGDVLC